MSKDKILIVRDGVAYSVELPELVEWPNPVGAVSEESTKRDKEHE